MHLADHLEGRSVLWNASLEPQPDLLLLLLLGVGDRRYRDLDGIPWGVQERLHYQAGDGLDLDGLLVLPPGRSRQDGPFPLVTIVHGGPYDRWTGDLQLHWVPSAQWFAHQGIAAFLPNPRGGLGRGHEFAAAVAHKVGQEEWHDIETGIDLLVGQGIADPDRLGIAGWSHGGFMAAWATTRTHRFKAALVGGGISDWPRLIATGEWGAFEAALSDSAEHSPLTYADRIRTPMLIVHGADDTNVPVEQAELLHRAVKHLRLAQTLRNIRKGEANLRKWAYRDQINFSGRFGPEPPKTPDLLPLVIALAHAETPVGYWNEHSSFLFRGLCRKFAQSRRDIAAICWTLLR